MAKKAKTESVLSRQTRIQAEADALAMAEKAAETANAAAQERLTPPAARPAEPKKVKKVRYVREKKVKQVPVKPAALLVRSTTAAGKLMSKNITASPEDEGGGLAQGRNESFPPARRGSQIG